MRPAGQPGGGSMAETAEVDASERFHKEGLVTAHEHHRASVVSMMHVIYNNIGADDAVTQFEMGSLAEQNTTVESHISAAGSSDLHSLQPIQMKALRIGRHHLGRVLHGRLCAEPFRMVAVQTILEDDAGHAAKLFIYNSLPSNASLQDACTMFHKGMKIAIKEPHLKRSKNGCLILRVDNPASIVEHAAGLVNSTFRLNVKHSPVMSEPEMVLASRELRSKGNETFQGRNWKLSIQLYSDALVLLLESHMKGVTTTSSENFFSPAISQELLLGFSIRAEARLRLEHFEQAERDAFKALYLDPHHVKSLHRRGKALHGLHLYEDAALCFKKALDFTSKLLNSSSSPNDTAILDMKRQLTQALEESRVCHKQASTGEYDLVQIFQDERKGKQPVCAEYVGPVVVGRAVDKPDQGRGLLVTKDVDRGELLLVTKAVAHAKDNREFETVTTSWDEGAGAGYNSRRQVSFGFHEDIARQLMQMAMASERFKEQIYSLAYDSSPAVVANLQTPDMVLFSPRPSMGTSAEADPPFTAEGEITAMQVCRHNVEINRLRGVARTNSNINPNRQFEGVARLWLLPSFINHSCTPTACWVLVNEHILFIRAACNLREGQEVTIPYMHVDFAKMPYRIRARHCQVFYGFQCGCERCVFEKSMLAFTMPLEARLIESLVGAVIPEVGREVVQSMEWMMERAGVIREERQKHWLRTSIACAYKGMLGMELVLDETAKVWVREMLRGVQATLGGVEEMLTQPIGGRILMQGPIIDWGSTAVRTMMCQSLYGKQSQSALKKILDARSY